MNRIILPAEVLASQYDAGIKAIQDDIARREKRGERPRVIARAALRAKKKLDKKFMVIA